MKPICISGGSFIGNHGAEAMLVTCIKRIRERFPGTPIAVLSPYFSEDRAVLKRDDIILLNSSPVQLAFIIFPFSLVAALFKLLKLSKFICILPKAVRIISQSSAQVDLAGVSFMDSRQIFLPFNILSILPAILLGVPVIKFAQALGPFKRLLNRLSAQLFLKRCKMIFARGNETLNNLKEFGIAPESFSFAPDVAFCHKVGDSITYENSDYCERLLLKLQNETNNNITTIGICPSSLLASKSQSAGNYTNFISEITSRFLKMNYRVILFPNATRQAKMHTLRNNDLRVIQDVKLKLQTENFSEEDIIYVEKNINADVIKNIIIQCNITIVSRFHAMIASLTTQTPVFVLSWSHKYLEVMKLFGMEEMVIDYNKSNTKEVIEKVIKLIEQREFWVEKINGKLPDVYKQSFSQFEYLFNIIELQSS